ncbi:MAG: DUF4097 family beta strand repeat protein [Acidobacteria bacterium]|nr:DUF4097 family beta strand repeat protein [Acidobacteriota bacterium]
MAIRSLSRLAGQGLVLATAILTLAGCDVMVGMGGFGGKEIAKNQWTKTFTLQAGGQLEIVNVNGAIQTEASDGSVVEVVADRSARATTLEAAKDLLQRIEIREDTSAGGVRLVVKPPAGLGGGQTSVEFKVKVPRTVAVRLVNSNGRITVTGAQGPVRAEVTNGSVVGRGLGGAVDVNSTNGSVSIDVDTVSPDGIRLGTTNGGVQLTLPAGARADLRARCVNGGISVSNLTLEHGAEQSRRRVDAKLNGGGPLIDLGTTNGGIKITGK